MLPSPAPDSCIIYLVRHAATDNNLAQPPRLQGSKADHGLSAEGQTQARQTGQLLAGFDFAAIYSSPLRRARETAAAIARPHGLDHTVVPALEEINVGSWEQRSWQEISQSDPEAYRLYMQDPSLNGYRDGENLTQLYERVRPALQCLAEDNLGQQIVVVSHNVVNRVFLSQVIGLPLKEARRVNQDNCGISIVRYQKNTMKLLTLNATFHMAVNDRPAIG